ncbi:hypothetical protein AX15_006264 [Amanita polypyramis BW_CC]|nr:hypothetical protein AX15_006264 [Amanita polypyramis BW_CC]
MEATRYIHELHSFDPYAGNLLESIIVNDSHSKTYACIAFPMGELKNNLNLSPILYSADGVVLKPSTNSIKTFQTPILQIVGSRPSNSLDRIHPSSQGPHFAVRSHGHTTLFKAKLGYESEIVLENMATLYASDVGGRAILDVRLTSEPESYFVNDYGAVFRGTYYQGSTAVNTIQPGLHEIKGATSEDLWRLALGANPSECILLSGTEARLLDSRANSSLTLFSLDVLNNKFTSLEDEGPDGIVRLCTTDQILYIDKRWPNKPLLGLKHGRNHDPTLQIHTIQLEHDLATFLTSRKNSLMTIYEVSRPSGFPISVHTPPYCLPSSIGHDKPNIGQLFFRHPYQIGDACLTLFQMCERGSINYLDLLVPTCEGSHTKIEWPEEMNALNNSVSAIQGDTGALGMRDKVEMDFSSAYEHLFCHYEEQREELEEEEAENLYDLLEQAPLFWQTTDISEEQVLTSYDILFRAGEEPRKVSKADFLSDAVINSVRGYRALAQGRLSTTIVGKGAAWSCDLSPILEHFVPGATQNIQELTNHLSQFDLHSEGERSYKSVRREIRAREQLALDMVLASGTHSSQYPVHLNHQDENLESLTEALSLVNDAPPIRFGFLHPVKQGTNAEYDKDSIGDIIGPPSVRLLLKEWQVGANPKDYAYHGPSHDTDDSVTQLEAKTRPRTDVASRNVRPPTIMSSTFAPAVPELTTEVTRPEVFSQDMGDAGRAMAESATQEMLASTQIVPGPYGGRSALGKKKVAKKRLGGF